MTIDQQAKPETLRIGFIGTDRLAQDHFTAFTCGSVKAAITAISDPDRPADARAFADLHGLQAYEKLDQLLDNVDIVFSFVGREQQQDVVRQALQRGRHVLCSELPRNLDDCAELDELARRRDLTVGFSAHVEELFRAAHVRKELGTLRQVDASALRVDRPEDPAGYDQQQLIVGALVGGLTMLDWHQPKLVSASEFPTDTGSAASMRVVLRSNGVLRLDCRRHHSVPADAYMLEGWGDGAMHRFTAPMGDHGKSLVWQSGVEKPVHTLPVLTAEECRSLAHVDYLKAVGSVRRKPLFSAERVRMLVDLLATIDESLAAGGDSQWLIHAFPEREF